MIDITIKNTPIKNPSANYIFDKVGADLNAFDNIESSDVVRSLFGVKEANPSAIDITQSIVNNLGNKDDMTRIRSILQDRGHSGVIWRFTTTKQFMLELSKNLASSGNYLSLTLIRTGGSDSEVTVRELVRFNKDGVTFLDKRNKSIETRPSLYDDLKQLHEEAVAATKQPEPPAPQSSQTSQTMMELRQRFGLYPANNVDQPTVFVPKGTQVFFIRGENNKIQLRNYKDGSAILSLVGDIYIVEFSKFCDEGTIFETTEDIDDFDVVSLETIEPHNLSQSFCDNLKASIKDPNQKVEEPKIEPPKEEPEPPKEEPEEPTPPPEEPPKIAIEKDQLVYIVQKESGLATIIKVKDEPGDIICELADPNFDDKFQYGCYRANCDIPETTFKDYQQLDTLMENFNLEFLVSNDEQQSGVVPTKPENRPQMTVPTTPEAEKLTDTVVEKAAETLEVARETGATHADLAVDGQVVGTVEVPPAPAEPVQEAVETSTVTVDISKEELPASEQAAHPEGIKIDLDVQITPGSPEIKITGGTVTDNATVGADFATPGDTGETVTVPVQQPTNMEENPVDVNIIIEAPFQDASESIIAALKKIYMANPEEDMLDYTNKLRKMTELDNICVHHEDDTYLINDKPEEGWFPKEEVQTVDINDQQIQMNLLNGLFGTVNPAITHLQKYLKNHLTEEQNAGFLATGTFPTETLIVWNEKPYDLTVSIVKYKDGRFYRIYLAKTNPGLTDHSYIATKDIPDRWVRLGSDIQDRNEYRTDYRSRR